MNAVNLNPKSPIEAFISNFHYAWNSGNPRVSLEHYVVNWSIENLQLLMLEEHKSVSSPEFVLNSSKTSWSLEVYPNGLCNAAQNIDILIKRSNRVGPSSVGLTFRFGVLRTDGETSWLDEKIVTSFRKNAFRKISVQNPLRQELSEDKFQFGEVFTITCEMYVTYAVPSVGAESLDAAGHDLVNFAFDLMKLLKAVEITDFTLRVPGLRVGAHKAIVAARSATVRELLTKDGSSEEVGLEGISPDCFVKTLHFMYSGNLTFALKGELPSIGFYECARKLGVEDLTTLLSPGRLRVRSVLKSQELNFTWTIRDFRKRSRAGKAFIIKSQGFGGPSSGAPKWHLIAHFDRASDTLGIFVETTGEIEAVHAILKISLLDGNGETVNTHLFTHLLRKPGRRFGFPVFLSDFSNQNLKYELIVDDALRVHCELVFVVAVNTHESHELSVRHPSSPIDAYRDLSGDFSQLLKTGAFSDVTVKAWDGSTFAVHRAVMFARSRKFYSKFLYYNRGERNLDVFDVEPGLLRLMIEHAYTGILKRPSAADDLLSLHKAADAYVFRQLAFVTLNHVASRIDAGNVFRLLQEGNKLRDKYLEEKCVLFVRKNWIKVMEYTDWEGNEDVCDILAKHLNKVTIER